MTTRTSLTNLALCALVSLLPVPAFAAKVLALDFNAAVPAMEIFTSTDAVKATPAPGAEGTIDTFRGERSGTVALRVDASAAQESWNAGLRTPLLAVANAESARKTHARL